MDISFMLGIAAFGITGTVIAVFLKESRLPVFALLAALATAVTVLIQLLPEIRRLWEGFSRLSQPAVPPERMVVRVSFAAIFHSPPEYCILIVSSVCT